MHKEEHIFPTSHILKTAEKIFLSLLTFYKEYVWAQQGKETLSCKGHIFIKLWTNENGRLGKNVICIMFVLLLMP